MIKFATLLLFTCLLTNSYSQITKGNWLIGGAISFSNDKDRNDFGSQLNETQIDISGNVGYFFIDKLSLGLRPDLLFAKTKTNTNTLIQNNFSIGPFARYYFLPIENTLNLFVDGGYAYGTYKVTSQKNISSNTIYFSAGPSIFLNTAVAVELSVGYHATKFSDNVHSKRNIIQAGIGLQFHLEKE